MVTVLDSDVSISTESSIGELLLQRPLPVSDKRLLLKLQGEGFTVPRRQATIIGLHSAQSETGELSSLQASDPRSLPTCQGPIEGTDPGVKPISKLSLHPF